MWSLFGSILFVALSMLHVSPELLEHLSAAWHWDEQFNMLLFSKSLSVDSPDES